MLKKVKEFFKDKIGYRVIYDRVESNRKISNEILWGQIFNNTITDSKWLKVKSFSPGRWALGYPALYIEYRVLNDIKPQSILEFGLGESSKLTIQYLLSSSPEAQLRIIEQDENWLHFFSTQNFDVRPYVKLLPITSEKYKGNDIHAYDNLIPSIKDRKYDFIIIDGPWGSPQYSRHQIVDIIEEGLLADNFVILMDDYNRIGEWETMQEVIQVLNKKNIQYVSGTYSGAKDSLIVCSENYNFLVSL